MSPHNGQVTLAFDHGRLRTWRLESGIKPEEVCVRAGVSYPHLRRLEDTGGNPSGALLARLAALYGRDLGELFTPAAEQPVPW